MRIHTQEFKEQIKELGRQIDNKITYGTNVISSEQLFSVRPVLNAELLKSVMKELDFESSIEVPINSAITYEFGLKVGEQYEYINYGNYIVYSVEFDEDTGTYHHVCYDSMLFSMKEYTTLQNGTFPMTITQYITNLCLDCGLIFKNTNDTFANYNKMISSDLYANLGYTYRDIFDELSQVTGSNICIDSDDMVEVRYITETNDTINEEYLKDINVTFGEKYGPINSIVLSRSAESDNVYLKDELSATTNGLCEIKIIDNQIMNNNDRSEYLTDLLNKLNGLEYYLNDYSSTGVLYYELGDKYNVQIGNNIYPCLMLNDEPKITQGLVENIFTEKPEESVTDYTKADKTDRKINQTYLIVDKQNKQIQSVIDQTDEQNQKIAKVTQTVEELNSKISDIADITTSQKSDEATVSFEKINESEPIRIEIRPIGEDITNLLISNNMLIDEIFKLKQRLILFENLTTGKPEEYMLPNDLLYYDSENYDEFILDYDAHSCIVNKKVGYNEDGTKYLLDKPKIIEYDYPTIPLKNGDYRVSIVGYEKAYLMVRLMVQGIYTTQFYTKAETDSKISQTANTITSDIDAKLSNYSTTKEMNNTITQSVTDTKNSITSEVSLTYSTKNETNTAKNEAISSANSTTDAKLNNYSTTVQMNNIINQAITDNQNSIMLEVNRKANSNDVNNALSNVNAQLELKVDNDKLISEINASADVINLKGNRFVVEADNFQMDKNGNMICKNAKVTGEINSTTGNIGGWTINSNGLTNGKVFINSDGSSTIYTVADLIIIRGYIMQLEDFKLPPQMIKHYDLNGDGVIDSLDYSLLQSLIGISMS